MKHINDKLHMLGQLQIGTTLLAGAVRHQRIGDYYAALVIDGDNVRGVHNVFSACTHHELEVIDNKWFPAAFGKSANEALMNLDAKLKDISLDSSTIQKWMSDVTSVERGFAKVDDEFDLLDVTFATYIEHL